MWKWLQTLPLLKDRKMAFWNNAFGAVDEVLPEFKSLPEGIGYLMGRVRSMSDSLADSQVYVDKRWLEVRDDLDFQESVLHVFKDGGSYLRILDGDIASGSWEASLGGLIIKFGGKHELYELVFLDLDFFILKKHGQQGPKGGRPYFVLAREGRARGREWPELLELLFQDYKSESSYFQWVFILFVLILGILLYSIL